MTHLHHPVHQGRRAETLLADGGGYEGENGEELLGVCNITKLSNVIEVHGSYHDGNSVVVIIIVKGGGNPKGVRDVLRCGGTGSTYFLVGDVDDDPPHVTGNWGVQHRVAIWITGNNTLLFLNLSL